MSTLVSKEVSVTCHYVAVVLPTSSLGYVVCADPQSNTCSSHKGLWFPWPVGQSQYSISFRKWCWEARKEYSFFCTGVQGCCLRSPECLYRFFAVIWLFTERKHSLWHPCPPGLLLQSCLDVAFFFAHLRQRQERTAFALLSVASWFHCWRQCLPCILVCFPSALESQRATGNNGGRCCFYSFNHVFVFQVRLVTPSANQTCGWPSFSASPSACCRWLAFDSWRLS